MTEIIFPPVTPLFTTYCIDYRYDALSSDFFKEIGLGNSYYLATTAGAALCLGYAKDCKTKKCCPGIKEMKVLKTSFVTNLKIALTLRPITLVYLLNHQDCGAIRAFLPCSGYPTSPSLSVTNKKKEIEINTKILTSAKKVVEKKFSQMNVILGLIDVNGSVANYEIKTKSWTIVHVGHGEDPNGLWFGFPKHHCPFSETPLVLSESKKYTAP